MEEQKGKKNISKIIIVILLVIILGLGGFIFINRDALFSKEKKESNTKPEETEVIETDVPESEEIEEEQTDESSEVKPIEREKVTLDQSKCVNCVKGWKLGDAYVATAEDNSRTIKVENGQATVTVNWDKIMNGNNYSTGTKTYPVKNLSKRVKSAMIGGEGQDDTGTFFLFALEDGTVEYIDFYKKYKTNEGYTDYKPNISNNSFVSQGKVKNIKNIIKFYRVNISTDGPGFMATFGETANGNLYYIKVK